MKEGIYLTRLEKIEEALSGNSMIFGRQLSRVVARGLAVEEMFILGNSDHNYFKSRWLIFKNRLLSFFAPGITGRLLSMREEQILSSMKDLAEQKFLEESVEKMKGNQAAHNSPEQVEEPKKP